MFQNQNNVGNLYSLEPMLPGNNDHQLIVKSIMNTSSVKRRKGSPSCNFAIEVIYRVKSKVAHKSVSNRGTGNILVFHGTPLQNVDGILRYGFRPSSGLTLKT